MDRAWEESMRREVGSSEGKGYRQLTVLLVVAFVVALGVVVGLRMSPDAIAVLTGVIAGVAASIPTALLLMAVTRRRVEEVEEVDERAWYPEPRRRQSPPVIVVTPGQMPQTMANYHPSYAPYPTPLPPPSPRREFRVMGYDGDEEDQVVEVQSETREWYR
jgi:hypothetical protein